MARPFRGADDELVRAPHAGCSATTTRIAASTTSADANLEGDFRGMRAGVGEASCAELAALATAAIATLRIAAWCACHDTSKCAQGTMTGTRPSEVCRLIVATSKAG